MIYIDESIEKSFIDECGVTCELEDIPILEEYFLDIFLEGNVRLIIYEIKVEIIPSEREEEIVENETLPSE